MIKNLCPLYAQNIPHYENIVVSSGQKAIERHMREFRIKAVVFVVNLAPFAVVKLYSMSSIRYSQWRRHP